MNETELDRRRRPIHLAEREYVRDDHGRFAETGGGGETGAAHAAAAGPAPASHSVTVPVREPLGTTRPTPIKAKDLGQAVDLILKGETVELPDVGTVHTVLEKLADIARDAEARGEKAPDYDLCKVSVAGSNLFCGSAVRNAEHPEGIKRVKMPQLGGQPVPGSEADKLPRDENGEVNAAEAFAKHLASVGITIKDETVPAYSLKASQIQLVGPKVAGMMTAKGYDPGKVPIFISSDGYVLDGHHRWAAVVGRDAKDGSLGESMMNVRRVDAPVSELLHRANVWTRKFGIKVKDTETALAAIFDDSTIVLPYREKLAALSLRWQP